MRRASGLRAGAVTSVGAENSWLELRLAVQVGMGVGHEGDVEAVRWEGNPCMWPYASATGLAWGGV